MLILHNDSCLYARKCTDGKFLTNSEKKKRSQLGCSSGKAQNILKKRVLFDLAKRLNLTVCYRCGDEILNDKDLSIEHKVPWLDSEDPIKYFFNLDNIGFSHLKCNISAGRNFNKSKGFKHPSISAYSKRGCRCKKCTDLNRVRMQKYRGK